MKAKKQTGPAQQHLYSRTSYLYQAATYLAGIKSQPQTDAPSQRKHKQHAALEDDHILKVEAESEDEMKKQSGEALGSTSTEQQIPLSRLLVQHLKAVALKGQIRLSPEMKQSMCKRCHSLLVPGQTAIQQIENQSRGGKKPWADVLTVTCNSCGAVKRFPVGARRQRRRTDRKKQDDSVVTAG